ncbi:MAG: RHS repeat-associated core domain-containing protein, partial [Sporolactobacillus sp.]
RYYDPQNGNFLAMDPDSGDDDDTLSQNGYTYAENNPEKFTDPNGNFVLVFAAAVPGLGEALLITVGIYLGYQGIMWLVRHSSDYKDVTDKDSRYANRETNVTKKEFEKNLKNNGWKKTKSKDGNADIFTKKGAKYSVRDHAKSHDGPTADFTPRGSKRVKLKIRLKK